MLLVSMFFASLANAATTYTYTGNNFDTVTGVYSTSDSVSGSFTVASIFPADMDTVDISQQVLSYSFTDGVNSLNESNSEFCTGFAYGIWVGTDSNGNLNEWSVSICTPVSTVPNPVELIMSLNAGDQLIADAGGSSTCIGMDGDACDEFAPDDNTDSGAIQEQPGTWAQSGEAEASPVPALNTRMAFLVAILLGLTGLVSVCRRKTIWSK